MDHKLQTVFALIAMICTLVPGEDPSEEINTCPDVFDTNNYASFSNMLKELAKCPDDAVKNLTTEEQRGLLALLRTTANSLESIHVKACQNVNPKNCSFPLIPANGGLICMTHEKTRYCKPMCNRGYDFGFLRRSRLYESCGNETHYQWTAQYLARKRLAICSESSTRVSGVDSAYFPNRCQDALYNYTQEKVLISIFKDELKKLGIEKINSKTKCLLCGDLSS
ncbi:uncharacterized protein LOC144668515 [Cetorhinus maximus]